MCSQVQVRTASIDDIDDVSAIADSHAIRDPGDIGQRSLMSGYSRADFQNFLDNFTFLVGIVENRVVGFIIGLAESSESLVLRSAEKRLNELTEKTVDILEHSRRVYIPLVAIHESYCGKGVGKHLHEILFMKYTESAFYAAVVEAPFKHMRSGALYLSMGFEKVGVWRKECHKGLTPFASARYFRRNI